MNASVFFFRFHHFISSLLITLSLGQIMQICTSVIPSIENSRRVRLGERTGGFFVGNRGDRWPSWLARESLGDFLDSMFILWNKEVNNSLSFTSEIFNWQMATNATEIPADTQACVTCHLCVWFLTCRVWVTCFLGITSVTSSRPTHRLTQCHWSQSSCSCQCMKSWDSHTPPLEIKAQSRKGEFEQSPRAY